MPCTCNQRCPVHRTLQSPVDRGSSHRARSLEMSIVGQVQNDHIFITNTLCELHNTPVWLWSNTVNARRSPCMRLPSQLTTPHKCVGMADFRQTSEEFSPILHATTLDKGGAAAFGGRGARRCSAKLAPSKLHEGALRKRMAIVMQGRKTRNGGGYPMSCWQRYVLLQQPWG
jgi:hypothetical protein